MLKLRLRSKPDTLPAMDDIALVTADVRWPDAAEMALTAARKRGSDWRAAWSAGAGREDCGG